MTKDTEIPDLPTEITPQSKDFGRWYIDVVRRAELADYSPVKGCMVIRPYGYAIWELMQQGLDRRFKATGHVNAYFPLLIPESLLMKEAEHVEGFAPQVAWVTQGGNEVLEERLVIRPTSETIIGVMYAKWVQSWRDLPILINQWANVVRWEMRPRVFLRTAEFLWQEGHTAHETDTEALAETDLILGIYEKFARDYLALPVFTGEKSASERFPGAVKTLCIEAMVQDRKAIQAGTSHFLGQNFAKASGIEFLSRNNTKELAWTTSWGVSTRLIGTVIMTHADDDGLILPPRIAPAHVVILPVVPKPETREAVMAAVEKLAAELRAQSYAGEPVRVEIDARDIGGGQKNWEWIKKGVPLRVEIGPRDLEKGSVAVARRDRGPKEKAFLANNEFVQGVAGTLEEIQQALLARATALRDANTVKIDTKEEFYAFFTAKNADKPEIHGGFALAHWNGSAEVEEQIKTDLKVTIRCIPFNAPEEDGKCILTGEPSKRRVVWAKSY